jgi:PAS domain S-box-containing protein
VDGPGETTAAEALDAGAADVWPVSPAGSGAPGPGPRIELAEHYARLQAGHVRLGGELAILRRALDQAGIGFVMTDPRLDDDPIVYANGSFCEMTGYRPEEVLGRNCRFLQGAGTDPDAIARIARELAGERPFAVELLNYRADGTPFWNELHTSSVRDERGRVVRRVGVQVDVSGRRVRDRLLRHERAGRERAEASERRSAFLAQAGPRLDASLDLRSTLESLTRLCVPFLGDVCVVEELAGAEARRIAAAAADPGLEHLVRALPAAYPAETGDDGPLARVLRTGRAEILPAGDPSVLGPEAARTRRLSAPFAGAAMRIPLKARGRVIGAMALLSLDEERRYSAEDLALAEELGLRAALALDNARLYERQSEVAAALQSGLVPGRLPPLAGVELAVRFRPAGDGSVIGGDFYDVLPAGDGGGFDVLVGDVTGKGARAAALTGLARHTLRTAARYEERPSGVLAALNHALVAERTSGGRYCTVAFARVRYAPGGRLRVTVSLGGHPLPVAVRATGRVEPVGRPGSILGWVPDPTLRDVDALLEPGDALVLYTDGVSEARTADGMLGDARLYSALEAASGLDAGTIASRLERATMEAGNPRDDVAVIVLRPGAGLDAQEAA